MLMHSGLSTTAPASSRSNVPCSTMARIALWLSIAAFFPPIGIAAIILGRRSLRQVDSSKGGLDGGPLARAALWIAHVQLALVTAGLLFAWHAFYVTAPGFRDDTVVQRFLGANDNLKTLDQQSAAEAEQTAQTLLYQMIAIEDQYHRRHPGQYLCQLPLLLKEGVEGSTKKQTLFARVSQTPYNFEISHCGSKDDSPTAHYALVAIPRSPRMPEPSALFCTDQTGTVRQIRGGTLFDCFERGQTVR
jgi:hypothetical protein